MNYLKSLFCISILLLAFTAHGQKYPILINASQEPLANIFTQLEEENDFLFSYLETAIEGITISGAFYSESIDSLLSELCSPYNLSFEVVDEKYVLISKMEVNSNKDQNSELPLTTICGTLLDLASNDPLSFANVSIPGRGTGVVANIDGVFEREMRATLTDKVVISYVGYEDKTMLVSELTKDKCPKLYFEFKEMSHGPVVVTEYLTDGISLKDNGDKINLNINRLKALPGQPDGDLLNTIQFLPGITSTDGSLANLSIHGGSSDQNLILWEDIPLYHTAHYFGMISALNPNIMNQANIFRGGFGADYGGRISGLIDLKSHSEPNEKSNFGAGINFLNASTHGNLSFLNKKLNVVYSLRRSISEFWRSPTFESITRRIHQGVLFDLARPGEIPDDIIIDEDFKFLDANLSASYQASKRDRLSFAWLHGQNDFQSTIDNTRLKSMQIDSLYLENTGFKIGWDHKWTDRFQSNISVLSSDYFYDYDYQVKSMGQNGNRKNGIKKSNINEKQFHLSNVYRHSNFESKIGYQLTRYDVGHQIINQLQDNPQDNVQRSVTSNLHVAYATFNSTISEKFGFDLGLRYSYFEKEKTNYLAPRVRLWFQPNRNFQFNIKAGRYHQFLSQLIQIIGDNSSIETPVWVLAGDQKVPVLSSNQFQIGGVLSKDYWTVEAKAYYKSIDGLSSLATGFDEMLEGSYKLGSANVKGLDLLIKKRWKNYRSWVSYSLSQIDHSFPRFFDSNFSAGIEQPHVLQWVHLYKYNNFDFSIGWKGLSGTPYSLIENFEIKSTQGGSESSETLVPVVNEYNSERLPFRHQLDATVLYSIPESATRNWKAVIGFSLLNIYNQKNLYNRSFFIDKKPNENLRLSYTNKTDLGITPNLSVQFYW